MTPSIQNVLPNPPAPPPSPTSSTQPNPPQTSDFSKQLSKAQSKPQSSTPAPQAQSSPTNAPPTPKETGKNSGQLGDRSNSQQKQQNSTSTKAEGAVEAESELQRQTQTQEDQANSADTAQNSPLAVLLKLPKVKIAQSTEGTTAKPAATKSTNQKANPAAKQTPQTAPAQNTTMTTAAVAATTTPPQVAPNTTTAQPKPAATENASTETDATANSTLKAPASRANVSPFTSEKTTAKNAAAGQTQTATVAGSAAPSTGKEKGANTPATAFADLLPAPAAAAPQPAAQTATPQPATPQTPVAQFAQANQQSIVSTIHGKLLPNGGTMNITLNPPDLGAMQISVHMENGVMSASFETSSDQATRLLSHTLGQLKNALETQGVTVDRLHVRQTSSSDSSSSGDSESNGKSSSDGRSAQQEQQRRETLRRMWRRIRGANDPLDLVA